MPGRRRSRRATVERADAQPAATETLLGRRVRQIAFAVALMGVGLSPFAPSLEGTLVLRLVIQVFFLLAFSLWLMAMAVEGRLRIRKTGIGVWLAVFAGAVISATVNAYYKYPAMLTAFTWFTSIAAFLYFMNECDSRRSRLVALGVLGASAFVAALHGLHQLVVELPHARALFDLDPEAVLRSLNLPPGMAYDFRGRLGKNRIFSTFLLPNSFAGFLVLVVPAYVGLILDAARTEDRRFTIWRLVFLFVMLAALYATKSKGGWMAFAAAGAAFGLWGFGGTLRRKRLQVLGVVLGLLIVWAVAQGSGLLPPLRDYVGSFAVRYGYWRAGARIVEKHPFVGVGLDNFADFYAAEKRPCDQEARRAHNDYVQMAAEMGILGLGLYVAVWAAFWRRVRARSDETILTQGRKDAKDTVGARLQSSLAASYSPFSILTAAALGGFCVWMEVLCGGTFRSGKGIMSWTWPATLWLAWAAFFLLFARRERWGPSRDSLATAGLGCGLIGFLAHSAVDFDHYVPGIFQSAWVMMGILIAAGGEDDRDVVIRPLTPGRRLAMVLLPMGATLILLYGFVLRVADGHVRQERALDPAAPLTMEARRYELEQAVKSNHWDAQNHALLSDVFIRMWCAGRRWTADGVSTFSQAVVHAREAVRLDPVRSEYYTRLGRLYEMRWLAEGDPTDYRAALDAYLQAERLFPSKPDTALSLARLYDHAGQYHFAIAKYRRARRLSAEQYHIPRKFTPQELKELEARIRELQTATTRHTEPPQLRFTQPRLLGWPEYSTWRRRR